MRARWVIATSCAALLATTATSAFAQSLDAELTAVRQATAAYQDVAAAERDGYRFRRFGIDAPLMGEHWVSWERMNQPIELKRPSVLQYIQVGGRRVLVGVTYGRLQRPGDPLPDGFAGSADEWHVHDMPELIERLTRHQSRLVRHVAGRRMEALGMTGEDGRPKLAMLHVWLWSDHPDGMFANYNPTLPYLRAGLPTSWARPGDYAAARGIDLLNEGACDRAAGRTRRFLGADRSLGTGCGAMRPGGERGNRRPRRRRHRRRARRGRRARVGGLASETLASLSPDEQRELKSLHDGMKDGDHHGH